MTSVFSQSDAYSIAKGILQKQKQDNNNVYLCVISSLVCVECAHSLTPSLSDYSNITLCWSARLRPAHISLTIRCHRSVSVFRLASKASFLP